MSLLSFHAPVSPAKFNACTLRGIQRRNMPKAAERHLKCYSTPPASFKPHLSLRRLFGAIITLSTYDRPDPGPAETN